jgi:hypothetical protein
MEVHHHPKVHHKEKPWKEYLLEGLMIFIAVTMGFFAETIRERLVEKEKEKQYVESLIADLKADIKNAEQSIQLNKQLMGLLDSLFTCINNPSEMKQQGDLIYYAGRMGPRIGTYVSNSRTFDQLSSGGFRLIQRIQISNQIVEYYDMLPHLRLLENGVLTEFHQYQQIVSTILDPVVLRKQEKQDGSISKSNYNPPLLNYNAQSLKQLGVYIVYINGSRHLIIPTLENIKKKAGELIQFLQKEYSLQSE